MEAKIALQRNQILVKKSQKYKILIDIWEDHHYVLENFVCREFDEKVR